MIFTTNILFSLLILLLLIIVIIVIKVIIVIIVINMGHKKTTIKSGITCTRAAPLSMKHSKSTSHASTPTSTLLVTIKYTLLIHLSR